MQSVRSGIWTRVAVSISGDEYHYNTGTSRLMHRKRVTCELHYSYFRLMTIKHAIPKTAEVTHSDIEWAIELLYNSVKTGSQLVRRPDQFWRPEQFGVKMWWRKPAPSEAGLQAPRGSTGKRERHAVMANRVGVNMLQFSSVSNSISRTIWRCPWCNGYRRRIWTRRHEFKSWTWLIAFHIALIPFGKVWIQLFSLQLWVNSRTD